MEAAFADRVSASVATPTLRALATRGTAWATDLATVALAMAGAWQRICMVDCILEVEVSVWWREERNCPAMGVSLLQGEEISRHPGVLNMDQRSLLRVSLSVRIQWHRHQMDQNPYTLLSTLCC